MPTQKWLRIESVDCVGGDGRGRGKGGVLEGPSSKGLRDRPYDTSGKHLKRKRDQERGRNEERINRRKKRGKVDKRSGGGEERDVTSRVV